MRLRLDLFKPHDMNCKLQDIIDLQTSIDRIITDVTYQNIKTIRVIILDREGNFWEDIFLPSHDSQGLLRQGVLRRTFWMKVGYLEPYDPSNIRGFVAKAAINSIEMAIKNRYGTYYTGESLLYFSDFKNSIQTQHGRGVINNAISCFCVHTINQQFFNISHFLSHS